MESFFDKEIEDNRLVFKKILFDNGLLITSTQDGTDPNAGAATVYTACKEGYCSRDGNGIALTGIYFDNAEQLKYKLKELFVDGKIIDIIKNNPDLNEDDKESLIDAYEKLDDSTVKELESSFKNINSIH